MASKFQQVDHAAMIASRSPSALANYCPDLANWPHSWEIDDGDQIICKRIVETLTPFLIDLLAQGLARKTLVRHRDNIWLLGGEMIRRRYDDPDCARLAVGDLLVELIEDGGHSLGHPSASLNKTPLMPRVGNCIDS